METNGLRAVINFKPGLTPLQRALAAIEFDHAHAELLRALSEEAGAPDMEWKITRHEFTGEDAEVQPVYDEIMRTLDRIRLRDAAAPDQREGER